jgi:hypothetical protein
MVHRVIDVNNHNNSKEYKLILINGSKDITFCFFYSITLNKIPIILKNLFNKEFSLSNHRIGFYKGPEVEERFGEPNFELKTDEIELTCGEEIDSRKICKLKYFYLMALKYAHSALEAVTWFDLLEKGIVDKQWVNEIKQWIIDNEDKILKMQEDENV